MFDDGIEKALASIMETIKHIRQAARRELLDELKSLSKGDGGKSTI